MASHGAELLHLPKASAGISIEAQVVTWIIYALHVPTVCCIASSVTSMLEDNTEQLDMQSMVNMLLFATSGRV